MRRRFLFATAIFEIMTKLRTIAITCYGVHSLGLGFKGRSKCQIAGSVHISRSCATMSTAEFVSGFMKKRSWLDGHECCAAQDDKNTMYVARV